jgi:hypothetical protein
MSAIFASEVQWASVVVGMEKDRTTDKSVPTGISVSSPLRSSPPRGSLCDEWIQCNNSVATAIFTLLLQQGTIVDVALVFTLANNFASNSISVATAVVGTQYYLALDGPTSNKVVPLGLPTTH